MKCIACDTPVVILRATGYCGTEDESICCPFATESASNPAIAGPPAARQESDR